MKRALFLMALCALLYGQSLSGSFHYDDHHSIVDNPHVRDWRNIPAFFIEPDLFSADAEKSMYRPLLLVTYALNYAISGYSAEGFRVLNIVIHGLCSLLVALLAEALLGNRRDGWIAGLFFAVHPLATEPVNYISSRSESLAALFYIGVLVIHLRAVRGVQQASVLFYGAGLLVKSIAISVPFAALSLDAMRGRFLALRRYIPLLLVAVGYAALVIHNRFIGDSLAAPVRSLTSQIYTQLKAPAYYLYVASMPIKLNVQPQFFVGKSPFDPAVFFGGLFALSLVCCLWFGRRTPIGWALLWAALVLAPTFLMPLNMLVNERRLYLPLAALSLAIAWSVRQGRVSLRLGGMVLVLFAALTVQRTAVWSDELTLWLDAEKKAPHMHPVQNNLGKALQEAGEWERALQAYARAIDIDPRHGDAYNNMATIHHLRGEEALGEGAKAEALSDISAAIDLYEKALIAYPTYEEIHQNLAAAHVLLGELDQAISIYEKALSINDRRGEIWNNYGQLLYDMEQLEKAEKAFRRAAAEMPDRPEPYNNLGNIYSDWKQWEKSIGHYKKAISYSEGGAETAAYNLTIALRQYGAYDEALSLVDTYLERGEDRTQWLLQRALIERDAGRPERAERILATVQGKNTKVLVIWAEVLSQLGRYKEAVQRFSQVVEGTEDRARALYGLGKAHMGLGDSLRAREAFGRFLSVWQHRDTRREQVLDWVVRLEVR
ncbi:MAG: hypothetical protein CME28_08000 [Gemmatimonadetes bacterium]|nr:hypothetical protein [Gemmatimonadota bacterium]